MKIRKNHIGKRYRYNVNRKRLNKTRNNTGKIKCPEVKEHWNDRRLPNKNYFDMGLATDSNKSIPMPNFKQNRLKIIKLANGFVEEDVNEEPAPKPRRKAFVADILEKEANEFREPKLRLPKGLCTVLTYFIDKYQLNYKAMVNDRKNFDQWTWKQFRMKIRKFMSIPEQFNLYLKEREIDRESLGNEYDSESEWK
ncbi:nucleolar protein 16 [Eupeodes corollae]|uniref:nucleolar protein 16 n=1 Tax=Eupeodes corollae TaxID=290404 RepID=UPI0024909F1C|nr:nucleolar protein 16 [Eupeodes corollae]XP_055922993.1 nucleolar protein 16 [Eupeodes corollae]